MLTSRPHRSRRSPAIVDVDRCLRAVPAMSAIVARPRSFYRDLLTRRDALVLDTDAVALR